MARLSVIMPVRDGERHVAAAVDSIVAQTYRDWELLVVDDGSGDGTAAIVAGAAARDVRVRVLSQRRLGIAAALRRGLAEASGEFVARMDADDVAAATRFDRQIAVMADRAEVAAIGTACTVIDATDSEIGAMDFPLSADEVRDGLATRNCLAHPTVVMRTAVLDRLGGYRPQFVMCEDYDLWLRMAEAHDLINLPEPLLYYRMHAGQCTWRAHRQRIVSEIAAQACASLRRAGAGEPSLPATGAVDLGFLLGIGLTKEFIAAEIAKRAADSAEYALGLGLRGAAAAAFSVALRQRVDMRQRVRLAGRAGRALYGALTFDVAGGR